jgi:N-hydroxyarylamine O-acetyltransferase
MLDKAQIQAYLTRVGYDGSLTVSDETLRGLHIAHTMHVPFENLDIHLGREISLEPLDLFEKIVKQRRGGYCYEMNGLFALVLESMGFEVRRLMARMIAGYTETRPLTHQALLVTIDGQRWIADVGNGRSGLLAPIRLENGVVDVQFTERFRLMTKDDYRYLFQTESAGQWENMYAFTLEGYQAVDYVPANFYNSHSPDSRFVQRKFCTMPTPEGRVTLTEMDLKITRNGETQVRTAANMDEYQAMLWRYFGIELDGEFVLSKEE